MFPRPKQNAPLSASSSNSKSCKKKEFLGTSAAAGPRRTKSAREASSSARPVTDHPWAGALDAILKPLPPDWRHNIHRTMGAFAEAFGNLFPHKDSQSNMRVGRRGF